MHDAELEATFAVSPWSLATLTAVVLKGEEFFTFADDSFSLQHLLN